MRTSIMFSGMAALIVSRVTSSILSSEVAHDPVGSVVDAQHKVNMLHETGTPNIRVITDKVNGEYMRPVFYDIGPEHVCKFYSEATRGVGYPIGEYKGPSAGDFGAHWAAFYECWKNVDSLTDTTTVDNVIPCGYASTFDGTRITMNEGKGKYPTDFAVNGVRYAPNTYRVVESCTCDFFGAHSRSGYVSALKAVGPEDGDFKDKKIWGYTCQHHG